MPAMAKSVAVGVVLLSSGWWALAAGAAETYRLVYALGNDETIVAKGLKKSECATKKAEFKAVAERLGTYNEATGYGSITCQPDSLFE